jgi:hypothetical protein
MFAPANKNFWVRHWVVVADVGVNGVSSGVGVVLAAWTARWQCVAESIWRRSDDVIYRWQWRAWGVERDDVVFQRIEWGQMSEWLRCRWAGPKLLVAYGLQHALQVVYYRHRTTYIAC